MNKPLVLYYSLKGPTIVPGMQIVDLEKGNTAKAAEYVAEAISGDLFEIETKKEYSKDYAEVYKESKEELNNHIYPELVELPDLKDYEIIFLMFPNWWNTIPTSIMTLLKNVDFGNKKVIPVVTSEGSGFGQSKEDIKALAPNIVLYDGKAYLGHNIKNLKKEIMDWSIEQMNNL